MCIRLILSTILALTIGVGHASDFEFCTFSGLVFEILDTENPKHKRGMMIIDKAKLFNDSGYSDCQDFVTQTHRFSFNSEKFGINKGDFVELNYRYWEETSGKAHENWVILRTTK